MLYITVYIYFYNNVHMLFSRQLNYFFFFFNEVWFWETAQSIFIHDRLKAQVCSSSALLSTAPLTSSVFPWEMKGSSTSKGNAQGHVELLQENMELREPQSHFRCHQSSTGIGILWQLRLNRHFPKSHGILQGVIPAHLDTSFNNTFEHGVNTEWNPQ